MRLKLPFVVLSLMLLSTAAFAQLPGEDSLSFQTRTKWMQDARFGMFIHWGLACMYKNDAGGNLSWCRPGPSCGGTCVRTLDNGSKGVYKAPDFVPCYDTLYRIFNPTLFNATEMVGLAKNAGMKYIVVVAKHHDGFAMWDTKVMHTKSALPPYKTGKPHSIMQSPYGKDIIKEFADAAHAAGLKFGVYYSPRDWYNTDYGVGDNSVYHEYMKEQVKELLTNYGRVDILWWDSFGYTPTTTTLKPEEYWKAYDFIKLTHELQPGILNNNRVAPLDYWGRGTTLGTVDSSCRGDYDTPEGVHNQNYKGTRFYENCMSAFNQWSWQRSDRTPKPSRDLIRYLCKAATNNGNYLLNFGPKSDGTLPPLAVTRLKDIATWMNQYKKSIHGTRRGPIEKTTAYGSTCKDSTMYLFFWNWKGSQTLPKISQNMLSWKSLTENGGTVTQKSTGEIVISGAKAHPIVNIYEIKLDAMLFDTTANMTAVRSAPGMVRTSFSPKTTFRVSGDRLVLKGRSDARVALFTLNGRFINEAVVKNGSANLRRDFGVPRGVYVARILSRGGSMTRP